MAETEIESADAPGVEMGETRAEKYAHPDSHYLPPNEREEGAGEGGRGEEPT